MKNENSLNSEKIESEYFYNSQDSKQSRNSRINSNKGSIKSPFDSNYLMKKEQRGNYSRSLDSGMRFDSKGGETKDKNIFDNNSFSEIENRIKRAPKNFVPPGHLPKQSIRTVKGNLYEALNNLNKEINVKIEKREIPKIRMSLLDYLDHNSEEQQDVRKGSKKIDIDDVMVNLSNIVKDNQNCDLIFTPVYKKAFADIDAYADDMNIEKMLENSNLNNSNSFTDKLGNCNSNNLENILNMNSENQTLYFSGLRLANEVDKTKFMNQMHSNYSSIHGKHSSIPYHQKKRNLKSLTIEDDLEKYAVKNVGYNSGADVCNINIEEGKVRSDLEISNKNKLKIESVYVKHRVSPIRKNVKQEPNTGSNFGSNFESKSQMNHSQHINENLLMFDASTLNNLNDLKEKEIFENLIKNDVISLSQRKKNSSMSSDNNYNFDFKQFLKFMKTKEIELNSMKNEVAFLQKDVDNKNNFMKSYETKQDFNDNELKFKIRELESQLSSALSNNSRLEKENGILKNELVNSKKNKNLILKRFNEEMSDMNKFTKEFFENFVSLEK